MPDFITTFQTLQNTPLPNVLVVAGIIFIFLAIAGQFAWEIRISPKQQIFAGVIGMIFLIFGVSLYVIPTLQPNPNEEKPTVPLTVAYATSDLVLVGHLSCT